ncbi:MAG: hypothetical protein ACYCZD_09020 [Rhodanobacter sp.]
MVPTMTALLAVPLFLASLAAVSAPPSRGQVIGPASLLTTSGRDAPMARAMAVPAPMAGSPACNVYFNATGQLNFNPPANNTALVPGISSANIMVGGPSFAHGTRNVPAMAGGGATLSANAGIDSVGLPQPLAGVVQNQIQGIAYFATDTNCTSSSFTTTVQSNPAGNTAPAPSGTVVAKLNGNTTMTASYQTQYADQGTYTCSGVYWFPIPCEVWRIDVTFNFLTSSFPADGAGNYSLAINQVTMTSP